MKIKTKYFKIDEHGLFVYKYRFTTSPIVEELNRISKYNVKSLPFGIKVYYI